MGGKSCLIRRLIIGHCAVALDHFPCILHCLRTSATIGGGQANFLTLVNGRFAVLSSHGKSLARSSSRTDSNADTRSTRLAAGLNGQCIGRIRNIIFGVIIPCHGDLKVICGEIRVTSKLFNRNRVTTRSTGDIISSALISNGLSSRFESGLRVSNRNAGLLRRTGDCRFSARRISNRAGNACL